MKKDCSHCEHLGRDCPKTLILLPLDKLIDWCIYVMEEHRITHEHLAQMSGTPKGTIDRILAKLSMDCRYSTVRAIVCALLEHLGLSTLCLDEVMPEAPAEDLKQQNAELQRALADAEKDRRALETRVADFVESHAILRQQVEKKDDHIDRLSNTIRGWRRVVTILAGLLGLAVLVIIASLVVDKMNPNLGFFWR